VRDVSEARVSGLDGWELENFLFPAVAQLLSAARGGKTAESSAIFSGPVTFVGFSFSFLRA
jgi:hypothetical protein